MIRLLSCALCQKQFSTPYNKKYCDLCSEIKDRDRKSAWAKTHPQILTEVQKLKRKKKSVDERLRLEERGQLISDKERWGITWPLEVNDDLIWLHRFKIPFSLDFSKNRMWSNGSGLGHVYLRRGARTVRSALTLKIKQEVPKMPLKKGKVWIDLLVQKPMQRMDAINVVDSICDAIKDAIGIDDRWFSIKRLDWQIIKKDPHIFIGIGQTITEHHFACTYCGRILPESTHLASHKSTCKDCRYKPKDESICLTPIKE